MRRVFAAAAIAACLLTGFSSAAAATSHSPHVSQGSHVNRECWGANRGIYDQFHTAVPASHCVRTYFDQPDVFPPVWPRTVPPGTWQLLSIRPSYQALMDGSDDTRIRNLCATAPPHAWLTIWHENAGANPLGYPPSIHNPANYVAMQKKMMALCAGTPARFGVTIIAPFGSVLNWLYAGDDWFGYDFFAFTRYLNNGPLARAQHATFTNTNGTINVAAVLTRMNNNLATVQKFTGRRCPLMGLPETNASKDSQRKTWFGTIAKWAASHDCRRRMWIVTRWTDSTGPHSGDSGPWPPSATVTAYLKLLAATYQ